MNQPVSQQLKNLNWKVLFLTALLLVSLAFVALTFLLLARNAQFEQGWISLATDVQVSSQQLAKSAGEAAAGNQDAFAEFSTLHGHMSSNMNKLTIDSYDSWFLASSPSVTEQMLRLEMSWKRMSANAAKILDSSSSLTAVRGAADEIFLDSQDVFNEAAALTGAIANLPSSRDWPSLRTGVLGLVIMIGIVALLVGSLIAAERMRATVATSSNRHNKQAILNLLDELDSLADGDLTVHASVRNEFTGAIADAMNYAIEQLRELVKGINITARSVAKSAQNTRTSTSRLAEDAAQQAEQIGAATETIKQMANSFDAMAERSSKSSDSAHRSVKIAHTGGEKVRETISGMNNIREQIQQTSKRIKRLGESTQEIGDMVSLINGIAEQTNILALNAAIQAASAGDAGKGFAIVADEVQQLAESATQATRRIENLVQTIQADTSEAVDSMESTTSEVVRGTRLAEDAGKALVQIENVSNELSGLIQEISHQAQNESATATEISEIMQRIRDVSVQTSEGSKQTAGAVEDLAELVLDLSDSVADFKLPQPD